MRARILIAFAIAAAPLSAIAGEPGKTSLTNFTLNAEESPDSQPWTEPASFGFTKDKGSKATIAADIAARLDRQIQREDPNTVFATLVVHRHTGDDDKQEYYAAQAGLHWEPSWKPIAWLWHDVSVGYSYKTIYPDASSSDCTATPPTAKCTDAHQHSLQFKWQLSPPTLHNHAPAYHDSSHTSVDGPPIWWSLGPDALFFIDDAFDAQANDAGEKPTGVVSGATFGVSGSASPSILNYGLVFRASVKQTEAFSRDSRRKASFGRNSTVWSASADYEIGKKYFEGKGWIPSIGVTYTNGDDPLTADLGVSRVVVAFKLTYRGK
jgi:hypothetical protein